MTLKSALQDVKETTLSAVAGLLGKLAYLASLRRRQGRYEHWGMESVYGADGAEHALKSAHCEILKSILRTPLATLEQDLKFSCSGHGMEAETYVEEMRGRLDELLPEGCEGSPASQHLSSVLLALCHLEKNRERATRLTS
ncbi:MAG TPA: hypothetical protein VFD30_19090 [Terriglobia bacterium]|nr:hypothetical protein [Terriglobia bacterium]